MRPNIIFYFSDQQRYDTFNKDVMPFFSKFAERGTVFDEAYTCQPVCGPARACLQTGVYASENGCFKNDIALKRDAVTIAKLLDEAGYDTAYIGKWHLASGGAEGNNRITPTPEELRGGYRYWRAADCLEFTSNGYGGYVFDNDNNKIEFNEYRADAINGLAIEYLESGRYKGKPFFMFVSQLEPHHQNSTDNYECPKGYGEKFKDVPIPKDLEGLNGNYRRCFADYLGCIRLLDENLERLVNKLESFGILDETVIIYASDHGCHFRTRNSEYKRSCHDASAHVPLALIGGGYEAGHCDKIVSLIDIPPTILSLAQVEIPENFRGRPLKEYVDGKAKRNAAYLEISESQLGRAIITDRFTYSVKKRGSFGLEAATAKRYVEDKMYDNANDKYQHNNIVADKRYDKEKAKLKEMLLNEIEAVEGKRPKIISKRFVRNRMK